MYSTSEFSSNNIFNLADAGEMWTSTGNWNQLNGKDAFWMAAAGVCVGEKTLFGMAGNDGVSLIEGIEQNMHWNCK